MHWNRLYGKKGLLQFQAVFASDTALGTIEALRALINNNHAKPILAVLKYFTKLGLGLLSFAQPGFTLAIDFINNQSSRNAILAMNEYITKSGGKIYLAKDLLLTEQQFRQQYPEHEKFERLLTQFKSSMSSNLSKRLSITR